MNYRQIRALLLLCATLIFVAACDDDSPLEGEGDVVAIVADKSVVILGQGDTTLISVYPIDVQTSRVGQQVNLTAFGTGISVDAATVGYFPELAETRAVVRVANNAPGGGGVILQAGGVTDTIHFVVAAPGSVSGLPAVIFRSPVPVFTEDIAASVAGSSAVVLSRTATEIALLLPFGASGETSYEFESFGAGANLAVSGAVVLPEGVTQEASEPNDTRATAAAGTLDEDIYGALDDDDIDDYYLFTAGEAGTYDFFLDWNDDSDVDMIIRNAAGSVINANAATGAHPEHTTQNLTAGQQFYVQVNMYEFHPIDLPVTTYTLHVTRVP